MAFNKSAYDQQYNKDHIKRKFLAFNIDQPEDKELLDHLEQQNNINSYIKALIRKDMCSVKSALDDNPKD